MSDNNDFDFNADDLFDDFDDDGGGFDDFDFDNDNVIGGDADDGFDEFDSFDNDADFEGDNFGADLDLDFIDEGDDEFGADDEFAVTEEQQSGGGPSGVFIAIAAVFILLLLGGLGLVGFLIFQGNQQAEATQIARAETESAIIMTNDAVATGISLSETAAVDQMTETAVANATGTAIAIDSATENAAGTATAIEEANEEATAIAEQQIADATASAEAAAEEATMTAEELLIQGETETAIAIEQTLNPPTATLDPNLVPTLTPVSGEATEDVMPTGDAVDVPAVQQTAQALETLFASTPTPDSVATQAPADGDDGDGDGDATEAPVDLGGGDDALPDTGLFDDVFGGNPMTIILAAFGLVGIIVVSRGVRGVARKET